MISEVTLLKELDEIGKASALKEVVLGQSKLLIHLNEERRYKIPKGFYSSIEFKLQKHQLEDRRIKSPEGPKAGVGLYYRKDIQSILNPYYCEPGFNELENGTSIANELLSNINDTGVFFPFRFDWPSLEHYFRIGSDLTDLFEIWEVFVDDEFSINDLAVGPLPYKQEREDDLDALFLRYKREREVHGFKDLLDFMFEKCAAQKSPGDKIRWEDRTGERHTSSRRAIEKKYSRWRTAQR